jgi:GrpB-like predicted nucleotidyltransferase (UPF0157 family)
MTHRAPIVIAPYDPSWPIRFEAERRALVSLLAPRSFTIEHVGSTSVPRLGAKPIIDIMLGCDRLAEFETFIPTLEQAGWQYLAEHEAEFPERRFLAKPRRRPRRFHLHVVELHTLFWNRHILFRDRLRQNPEAASSYEKLKISLALRFGEDRESYTDAKAAFIESVLREAPP